MFQIFGLNKCFDTKKALMYFKERRIPFSFIDLKEKEISEKEFNSILNNFSDIKDLLDDKSKEYKDLFIDHMERTNYQYYELINEYPNLLKTPILRFKNKAINGFNKKEYDEFVEKNKG
jgi:Spx/MgsR family transcriptional regulator